MYGQGSDHDLGFGEVQQLQQELAAKRATVQMEKEQITEAEHQLTNFQKKIAKRKEVLQQAEKELKKNVDEIVTKLQSYQSNLQKKLLQSGSSSGKESASLAKFRSELSHSVGPLPAPENPIDMLLRTPIASAPASIAVTPIRADPDPELRGRAADELPRFFSVRNRLTAPIRQRHTTLPSAIRRSAFDSPTTFEGRSAESEVAPDTPEDAATDVGQGELEYHDAIIVGEEPAGPAEGLSFDELSREIDEKLERANKAHLKFMQEEQ